MKKLLSIVLVLCAPAVALAIDEAPLLVAPNAFAKAFNTHQTDYPDGVFADDCAIIDEFPPYLWAGKGSAREWYSVLMAGRRRNRRSGSQRISGSSSERRSSRGSTATSPISSSRASSPTRSAGRSTG